MAEENCYEILGISSRADIAEVKRAYRRLSKLHHPDMGGEEQRQAALNLAKELLCDPVRRDAHDRLWKRVDPVFFGAEDDGPTRGREEDNPKRPAAKKQRDGLRRNVERSIEALRVRIYSEERSKKAETAERFRKKRRDRMLLRAGAMAACALSLISCLAFRSPIPLLAAAACAYPFVLGLRLSLDGFEFSPQDLSEGNIALVLERYVEFRVKGAVKEKLSLWERVKKHFEPNEFSFSAALPEKEMALRLLLGFFAIGYVPRGYDPSARILSFEDEECVTLVRYRHRAGRPSDIRYARDLLAEAAKESARSGKAAGNLFLFSTAGFSENAKAECRARGIRFYDAADFTQWLDELRQDGFRGPLGDVFDALAKFDRVLGRIRERNAEGE
jgi:hypothetical protein